MQDKMNKYAWWETDGERKVLNVETPEKDIEFAYLYKHGGGWWYSYEPKNDYTYYLCKGEVEEADAMLMVRDIIIAHIKNEFDYYKDMLEKFTSKEES